MSLGSNQGNTYTGREGVDLAFALNYNPRVSDIQRAFNESKLMGQQKKAQKAQGKANLAKWKAERPDFFYAHEAEKSQRFNDLMDWGSKLMEAGIDDPTTSSRPEAIDFQKAMGEINALSKESKAIEKRYNDDRQIVLNDKKGVYTDDSKQELLDWYEDTPLDKIISEGILPPKLKFKQPEFAATPFVQEMSGKINDDAPIENHIEFSKGAVVDNPMLADQLSQMIADMPKDAQNMLQQEADSAGQELLPYYLGKWSYSMKHKKPEDLAKLYTDLLDFKVGTVTKRSKSENQTGGGDTETVTNETEKAPWNQTKNNAASKLAIYPAGTWESFKGQTYPTYKVVDNKLARNRDGSLISTGEKVINTKQDMIERMAFDKAAQMPFRNKYERTVDLDKEFKSLGGSKAVDEDYDVWLADLSGRNGAYLQQVAASWMSGRDFNELFVKNAKFEKEVNWGEDFKPGSDEGKHLPQKTLKVFRQNKDGSDNNLEIDVTDISEFNKGLLSDIYYAGIKKDKFLYKRTRNKPSLQSFDPENVDLEGSVEKDNNTTTSNSGTSYKF